MVEDFFSRATGHNEPYGWQREVARDGLPDLIAVPTGFGKTEGAVLPWLYRTRHLGVAAEGRRLIYTLPMRSLVRQTHERVQRWLERLSLAREVAVVALAGGSDEASSGDAARAWMERPERPQIVIGTQDRLLSGALGRGYALSRFQWPVALGLLNADCHWVIDETQLMGPGLWTTAQLDWLRRLRFGAFGAARTTWMSATLARGFLQTVDRLPELPVSSLRTIELGEVPAHAKARRDARRPIVPLGGDDPAAPAQTAKKGKGATKEAKAGKPKKGTGRLACSVDEVASAAWLSHRKATLTLVIANTVTRAQALYEALDRLARGVTNTAASPSTLLITSRMRGEDRAARETALYDFEAARRSGTLAPDHPGLICVATQVVEAGVDISAERLFSDLAPWPSIVQRLGRLNRDGSAAAPAATFYWSELPERGAERLGPYPVAALDLSQELLDLYGPLAAKKAGLDAVAELASNPKALKALEDTPRALVRARDVHGLFGNEADLRGGFVDVSPFVRDADPEVDVAVFWRAWRDDDRAPPPAESDGPPVAQAECCPVGIFALRKHLQEKKKRAWRWDDRRAAWVALDAGSVLPGMVVMLGSKVGGYDERLGWTGRTGTPLPDLAAPPAPEGDEDDPRVGD
ncbi:MAG TPA: DEAD/DEAH box helicase, partial [Myxococcota bacterium]|nr:DEAD/DEAH box helicase [Myxococcota bacterium]